MEHLENERSNRMFNLFIKAVIIAFIVGFGLGVFLVWMFSKIRLWQ